jgi:biopolymer transport protein ExbD
MAKKWFSFEEKSAVSFNLTPVIDIVFLLIIFFALVLKFIEAENFTVTVPQNCRYAQSEIETQAALAIVTVIKNEEGKSDFAVGAEKVTGANYGEIAGKIAILIDSRLKGLPTDKRIVTLWIDKDIPYAEAQYALAAVAKSTATDIRLAAIKDSSVTK